jgi:hypothetical protein
MTGAGRLSSGPQPVMANTAPLCLSCSVYRARPVMFGEYLCSQPPVRDGSLCRARHKLPYAECSIMPSTRLYRVVSLKESSRLARVTRHNHRVARNAMSLSVGL